MITYIHVYIRFQLVSASITAYSHKIFTQNVLLNNLREEGNSQKFITLLSKNSK